MKGDKPSPGMPKISQIIGGMKAPYDYRETARGLDEATAKAMQRFSEDMEEDAVIIVDEQGNEKKYHKICITFCIEEERNPDWECEVRFPYDGNDAADFFRVTRDSVGNCVYSRVVDSEDEKKVREKIQLYREDLMEG
ncbi:MAG: hypothetical protein ACM3KR_07775 [Deltaproteobacteria bacterium]